MDRLFTLQYKCYLTNLKGLVPASDLSRIDPDALKWTSDELQRRQRPVRDPAGEPVLHRLLQQGRLRQGGRQVGADRLVQLYAACTKLKAAGYTPMVYGNGGQPLGAEFYPWYDMSYMMIGQYSVSQWQEPVQRRDPVDLRGEQRPS